LIHPIITTSKEKYMSSREGQDEAGKIFVGGIARDVDEGILTSYFSQFGNVCLATVMRDKFGISRGFGFVAFDPPDVAFGVLQRIHVIEGRTIEIKQAVKHDRVFGSGMRERGAGGSSGDKDTAIFVSRQVYVGGLPYHVSEKEVREYFEQFGPVVSANLKYDFGQQPPKFRGFGFVNFVEEESVEKALENYSSHQLGGKWIEVKRSKHSHVVQGENSGVIMPQMAQGSGSGRGGAYEGGRAPAYQDPYGGTAVKDPYGGQASGPVRGTGRSGAAGARPSYRSGPYGSAPVGPSYDRTLEARPAYAAQEYHRQPVRYQTTPSSAEEHSFASGARFDPYMPVSGGEKPGPTPPKSGGWRTQQPLNQL
jgi:heterogeneous nuclear ribonucleoprotein A1/A3